MRTGRYPKQGQKTARAPPPEAEGTTNNLEIYQNAGDSVAINSSFYTTSTAGTDTTYKLYSDNTYTNQLAQILVHG